MAIAQATQAVQNHIPTTEQMLSNVDTGATNSHDIADFLLSSLFGPGWENIVTSSNGEGYTTALFSMFELFNSTVMMVAGLMVTWTVIAGLAGSAYEGKSFGEKNGGAGLWTYSRMAYAIGMMAPLPGIGLSALQAVILALTMFSVNLANDLSNSMVNVMTGHPLTGKIKSASKETSGAAIRPLVFGMYKNNFRSNIQNIAKITLVANSVLRLDEKSEIKTYTLADGYIWKIYSVGNGKREYIGKATLTCTKEIAGLCEIKKDVFDKAIHEVNKISYNVKKDYMNEQFTNKLIDCPVTGNKKTLGSCYVARYNNVSNVMIKNMAIKISGILNGHNKKTQDQKWTQEINDLKADIKSGGFMLLGAYYIRINKLNQQINKALTAKFIVSNSAKVKSALIANSSTSKKKEDFGNVSQAGFLNKATVIVNNMPLSGNEALSKFSKELKEHHIADDENNRLSEGLINNVAEQAATHTISSIFKSSLNSAKLSGALYAYIIGNEDPIIGLKNTGDAIIFGVDALTLSLSAIRGNAKGLNKTLDDLSTSAKATPIFGTILGFIGSAARKVKNATYFTVQAYASLFQQWSQLIKTALISAVFFFSFYLPALPAILWLLAILGFLILVIEAVVAAPVWALAHAMPEGDGIAGQHGRQGYMMLLNILLRPALMVIGFYMAIALITSFSNFALLIMSDTVISNSSENSFFGPLTYFMTLASGLIIIGGSLLVVVHKSLGLITWLPENVIKWAGGQTGASLGESQDERRVAALIGNVGNTQPSGKKPAPTTKPKDEEDNEEGSKGEKDKKENPSNDMEKGVGGKDSGGSESGSESGSGKSGSINDKDGQNQGNDNSKK